MRNGRGKLDIPYLTIFSVILLGAVAVSLYYFPEWRESPATMVVLVVAAIGGVVGLAANFREAFIRDRADTPLPPLDYNSPQHRRNQENVCANVRAAWIDGVLRESLPERVRLELALDHPPGMLQRTIVSLDGQEPRRPLESAGDIADIFRAAGRALLILGAPGSGKTVTLLELCRPVLEGAEADPRRPVPVVLNLSTWAQKQAPLADWIADEMWRQYGLNRQVTPVWLAADHLILLLDGLDEVAAEARDACARAINAFRETHSAGMVVCSRSADYAELRERLALSNAVEIQPLTPAQIEGYLRDQRLALDGVREAIARDDALRELATTPLMLNVMALAYGGRPLAELLPLLDSEDERRAHLYDAYLARMFRRKPLAGAGYTAGQALRWLRFLAVRLTERDETQFFIEDMQPDWLPGRRGRWVSLLAGVMFGLVLGVVFGLVFGLKFGVEGGIMLGLVLGMVFGRAMVKGGVEPVDELFTDLSARSIKKAIHDGIRFGAMFGLLGGLFFNTLLSVFIGILVGVLMGLLTLFSPQQSKNRDRPNQGIRRSVVNTLSGGLLVGVLFSIPFILLSVLIVSESVDIDVVSSMISTILFGMLLSVEFYGGSPVLKHYLLRLLLGLNRLLPLRLVPYLETMRERILVQRAGAHYRFIHRTFQEHVAALTDERIERLTG